MPNVMAALSNTGGALCSTPQFGCAVRLPRRQTRWNLPGCPKLTKRSQPLVGRSSPYCKNMWGRYCCLTSFFPIVDACLSCEDIARQTCAMVRRWRFFASFLRRLFPASRVQHISDLHSKFALGSQHVWKNGRHPICGRCPHLLRRAAIKSRIRKQDFISIISWLKYESGLQVILSLPSPAFWVAVSKCTK